MRNKVTIGRDKRNKSSPWSVRWFGQYDPATGKQKRYCKSFKLKAQADAFAAEKAVEFSKGERRDKPDDVGVKVFCRDWLKTRKRELRPKTVLLYEQTIRRLCDYFGADTPLHNIRSQAAAVFISELKRMDAKTGDLSSWARHRVLRQCKTIFDVAVQWEKIGKNPFKGITPPKLEEPQDWHSLKPDEYMRLLDAAPTLRWQAFYALAYTTGLRFGELFSLRWDDLDLDGREVRVKCKDGTVTTPPFVTKNGKGREVSLPEHTKDILLKLQSQARFKVSYVLLDERQYAVMVDKWKRYQESGRAWDNQAVLNNVNRDFRRHLKKAGIEPKGKLSIHTLRKACITNWANSIRNPEVVRDMAGHSALATTMKFYAKCDKEQSAKAAAAIDKLLNQSDVKLTYEGKSA